MAGGVASLWLATTYVFWVGYTGDDDLFYARYAYLFHRPPINWWEFRLPAILAIRASFAAFGPSELAATFPMLLSSLVVLACVAWQVDWLRRPGWEPTLAVLVACTLPLDVGFRSVPLAGFMAAGLLAAGTVCILRGNRKLPFVGATLLAFGFLTHEASVFYVAILCFTLLAFGPKRFWKPVACCVALSGALLGIEAAAYYLLTGPGLSRFTTAAAAASDANLSAGIDPLARLSGYSFFLWPLQTLVFSKSFGLDLLVLVIAGILAWRRLERDFQVLFCTTLALYVCLGYGTQLPWSYTPFWRQFHYYFPLTLGIASVLPFAVRHAAGDRVRIARGIVLLLVLIHVLCLAAGGRWGQNFEVSRQLLQYAAERPSERFVTDVATMNHMYTLLGFRLPANVVCLNGPAVERHLLLNKEPLGTPRFTFSEGRLDAILVNLEGAHDQPFETEFSALLNPEEDRIVVAPVRHRLLFWPILIFTEPRPYMIRSLGGAVVRLPR